MRGLRRTPWSPVYWTIAAILLLGIVVAIVGGFLASDDRDIWVEVSKAGVGIALITVAGAVASIAVKHVDEARAREAALRRILHVVLGAYNAAKGARRNLRAVGLPISGDGGGLNKEQVLELRSVLGQLNEAQLALEATKREIPHSGLFRDPEEARRILRSVEDFINKSAIKAWEDFGGRWWPDNEQNTAGLERLNRFFVDEEDGGQFELCVSDQLDKLIDLIKNELGNRSPRARAQG